MARPIRIVGHGVKPADQFQAHPNNPRKHPQRQRAAVAESIARLGWYDVVIENVRTGHLIDGHERIWQALEAGDDVPFIQVDLSEEEERLALASHDWLSSLAEYDKGLLDDLLHQIDDGGKLLEEMAADFRIEDLLPAKTEDPGPQIDRAEELREKWGTARGQVWQVGEHRVMCGDSTSAEDVARLMGGESAQLVVTSPPYAVGKEYEVGVTFKEHLAMLEAIADKCIEAVVPGGFIFTNFSEIAAPSHAGPLTGSKRQCIYPISKDYWRIFHEERSCDLYAQRIWYKPFHRLAQPFWSYHTSIPHYQEWEHIWTWRTPGGDGDKVCDWDISVHAVWDTRNESIDDKPLTRHVAAFPVGIPERAIRAHSLPEDLVLEVFLGSGTTLVACQQTGRRGYGMEIDPAYVAVTLERLAGMGLEPRLVD